MGHKKKLIIIAIVAIITLVVVPAGATLGTHYYYFGDRIEHSNNYFEYLSELNPEFIKEEVQFPSTDGQMLSGAFYRQGNIEESKGLIIWVHGMGVNHENYLGEIEYMTLEGFSVFSYDNTGVHASEGDSLRGLTQSPLDLQKALEYVYELEVYNDVPNILIGHSWGGFAVATVSQLELPRPVDGIVSLAGFWKNINVLKDIAHAHIGDAVNLMSPYLNMYEKYIFGDYVELNGVDGLKNSTADVLLIHSENDSVVFHGNNFQVYQNVFGDDDRFQFVSYEKAGHKLTINFDSYMRIHDIMHHQMEMDEESDHYIELNEERLSLIKDYNFDVMDNITVFCQQVVDNYGEKEEYLTADDYRTDSKEIVEVNLEDIDTMELTGVSVKENSIHILEAGSYKFTGELNEGQIIINISEEEEVHLILDKVCITNDSQTAIYIENAKKAYISLEKETENTISTGIADKDSGIDASIFAESDLTINGGGTLIINSENGNGISSKKELRLVSATLDIDAGKHGLEGKDGLFLTSLDANISAGKDGLHSDMKVVVLSGIYELNTDGEGIEGQMVEIYGGDLNISSKEDGINASVTDESQEVYIRIDGGMVKIDANGEKSDGLDSNGHIYINGGTVIASSTTQVTKHTALDYDGDGIITGGTFIGTGSASEVIQNFGENSTQASITFTFEDWVSGELQLLDADGELIISHEPMKKYQGITISTADIKQGENYTVVAGKYKEEITMNSLLYQ